MYIEDRPGSAAEESAKWSVVIEVSKGGIRGIIYDKILVELRNFWLHNDYVGLVLSENFAKYGVH